MEIKTVTKWKSGRVESLSEAYSWSDGSAYQEVFEPEYFVNPCSGGSVTIEEDNSGTRTFLGRWEYEYENIE